MSAGTFAEAGLSDCATANLDCMPGFGAFLLALAFVGLGVAVWVTLSMSATLSIVSAGVGVLRGILWFVAVWILPLIGVAAWLLYARRARIVRPQQDSIVE